jgi:hypothetical protein
MIRAGTAGLSQTGTPGETAGRAAMTKLGQNRACFDGSGESFIRQKYARMTDAKNFLNRGFGLS